MPTDTVNQTETAQQVHQIKKHSYVGLSIFCLLIVLVVTLVPASIWFFLLLSPVFIIYVIVLGWKGIKGSREATVRCIMLLVTSLSLIPLLNLKLYLYRKGGDDMVQRIELFKLKHGHYPLTYEERAEANVPMGLSIHESRYLYMYSGSGYPTVGYFDPITVFDRYYYSFDPERKGWRYHPD